MRCIVGVLDVQIKINLVICKNGICFFNRNQCIHCNTISSEYLLESCTCMLKVKPCHLDLLINGIGYIQCCNCASKMLAFF